MTAMLNDQYLRVMEVTELLAREADHIDRREWQAWVDMYTPDSEFWMPAWRNEDEITEDPLKEISLIYLPDRGIEDRVFRFTSGDSYASTPLPTTSHCVGSVRVLSDDGETVEASAKAIVATMDPRIGNIVRGVWYDYLLVRIDGELKIKRKKVTFLERVIDGTVDVYNV
ncbi:aromatic-ring-hydroxylating dioxygenase subunit beta [Alcanivorax quisquiliarum]|uniref:Aromatic-ring-hydroxylating dioxygenase subunit beta n=1 Tax=Alcanivorax quisquiliarum TaxID=2933565 RepID=A0ABT0E9Q1_9GAMM|nr:aromatic-ring-hydroxylating dioxygenase subunit beta [Alcanivorax quisquiliarum]MCK0538347.1 aromatic-ring-hydroxylating dioxygenase subunit beta [Alcanivorax quisquiliarum]